MTSPADFVIITLIALAVFALGLISFVVFALVGAFKLVSRLFGGASQPARQTVRSLDNALTCRRPRCAYQNLPGSRFCARCGGRLPNGHNLDAYG